MTDTTAAARPPLGRAFTTVWAGQTASLLGTNVSGLGVSIAAFVQTGSVWWLAVLYLAVRLPGLLAAPFAGELVDRVDRRRVLLAADGAAGLATATALGLLAADRLALWHLVVLAVVGAVATAFQEPAYTSSLPLLVPRASVDRANGMLQLGPAVGMLAGPALAGVLVAWAGIGGALVFDLVTFGLAMVATCLVRIPAPPPDPTLPDADPRTGREARGLRATWRSLDGRLRGVRRLLLFAAVLNVVLTVVNVLLFALLVPLAGEAGAGGLLSLGGLAMLATAATLSTRGVPARRVRATALGTAVVGAGLVLVGVVPSVPVVAVGLMATLAGAALCTTAAGAIHQTEVPLARQGRLSALRRVASEALVPVAALAVAPLADGWAEPALAADGPLAGSVGLVLGTGPGRGVGLLFVLVGLAVLAVAALVARDPALRPLDRLSPADAPGADAPVVDAPPRRPGIELPADVEHVPAAPA